MVKSYSMWPEEATHLNSVLLCAVKQIMPKAKCFLYKHRFLFFLYELSLEIDSGKHVAFVLDD